MLENVRYKLHHQARLNILLRCHPLELLLHSMNLLDQSWVMLVREVLDDPQGLHLPMMFDVIRCGVRTSNKTVCVDFHLEHVAGIEIQDSQLAYDVLPFC